MSKVSKRPDIVLPTREEDKAITVAAKSDPDAQPLTPKQLKAMVPMRDCADGQSPRTRSYSCRCATAQRLLRTSSLQGRVGSRAWMACCANTSRVILVGHDDGTEPLIERTLGGDVILSLAAPAIA